MVREACDPWEQLPAWFTERMMTDHWFFGLMMSTGHVLGISCITSIDADDSGELWLNVEMLDRSKCEVHLGDLPLLYSPTSRTTATINARHVVAAFELADT